MSFRGLFRLGGGGEGITLMKSSDNSWMTDFQQVTHRLHEVIIP